MMKRTMILSCAAGLILILGYATSVSAQNLEDRIRYVQQQQARAQAQAAARTANAVNRQLPFLEFNQTPAEDALRRVARTSGVNIIVNWNAMELAGIPRETPIDLRVADMSVLRVITLICDTLSPDEHLIVELDEHFVRIMTREQANVRAYVRVYPIQDIMMRVPDYTNAPELNLSAISQGAQDGGSEFFSSGSGDSEPERTESERAQDIIELIQSTIEPEIWQANGGRWGSIRYYRGNLIVRAPSYVHAQIDSPRVGIGLGGPRAAAPPVNQTDLAARPAASPIPRRGAVLGNERLPDHDVGTELAEKKQEVFVEASK